MRLRLLLAALFYGIGFGAGLLVPHTAAAIEVQCIEASKYKYLYLIFGNDRRKFADYFQVDPSRLPADEDCRAIAVTGRVESLRQSREAGQSTDADMILEAIGANKGWLATIYWASPGGNIATGLAMAQIVRIFWLKSEAAGATTFVYWPDFIPRPATPGKHPSSLADAEVPPELAAGWGAYVSAVASLQTTLPAKQGRCASACTFGHVSGIERHGTIFVHRGRPGATKGGPDPSMAQILEGLHRAENRVIALYRTMDGGEDMVQLFQATPTATVRPAVPARYPRYIFDLLRSRCKGDSETLLELEAKLRAKLAAVSPDEADKLKRVLANLHTRRIGVERCNATNHERERLTQYAKFCATGCNRSQVVAAVNARLRALGPTSDAPAKAEPRPKPRP